MAELVLLRHGQTPWSVEDRHTGATEIDLDDVGRAQARALAPLLSRRRFQSVWCSPRQRAADTAAGAGLSVTVTDPRLSEWDYGGYEGLTTQQIRERADPQWTVFTDGVVPGATPGETLAQVAGRAKSVQADLAADLAGGDVAVVAHGHYLRVFTAVWLGADPQLGAQLQLAAGSLSVLGHEHALPTVKRWNLVPT